MTLKKSRNPLRSGARLLLATLGLSVLAAARPARTAPTAVSSRAASESAENRRSAALLNDVKKKSYEIKVAAGQIWTDTKIDLQVGERILITSSGTIQYPLSKANGPEGSARGWKDLLRFPPVKDAGRGALIGRIGGGDASEPFLVGARKELVAPVAGRLYLGVNEQANDTADGNFVAKIQILDPGPASAKTASPGAPAAKGSAQGVAESAANVAPKTPAPPDTPVPSLTREILNQIPRRIGDKNGKPGDMVNFLVLGSEDQLRRTFQAAGWVLVDRTKTDAVLHGILATISKQAYTEMPMSELYLFGRPQDFGFAHAEPLAVVATRHHLRVWQAPFQVAGQTLWVGAATHDIGFEKDQRNGSVTHKIDPNIDLEREYVGQTLGGSGIVAQLTHALPENPLTEAHTATGGTFHSDGRVLVMVLANPGNDRSAAFANLFCSVLEQEHPDSGEWGDCTNYIATPASEKVSLAALPTKYRVLIVPGIMHSCTSSTPAYKDSQEYLQQKYGMTVEYFGGPDDSSEAIAPALAKYLKDHSQGDSRKYILVGYSKGAVDVQEALVRDSDAASAVAAVITVSGAMGGSPIAEALPAQAERWIKMFHYGSCQGDLNAAFKSLRKDVRQAFLSAYPNPVAPTYSLSAVSEKTNTSKALLESWQLLSVYGPDEDGQILKLDAIASGAANLGSVRADHFAVALPLDAAGGGELAAALDHNRYPRTALLESLLRFVIQDLDQRK